MSEGFVPGSGAKWAGFFAVALVCFFFGFTEFMNPSLPPFTGRGSTMKALAHGLLGQHGIAICLFGLGVVFVVAAYTSYRFARSAR